MLPKIKQLMTSTYLPNELVLVVVMWYGIGVIEFVVYIIISYMLVVGLFTLLSSLFAKATLKRGMRDKCSRK